MSKPRDWSITWVSHMAGRGKILGPSSIAFPHALADSWIGEGVVRSAPVGYVSIIGSIITCYTKIQVPSSLNLTQLQLCFIRVCLCVCVRVVIIQKFGEYFIYFCL